MSESQTAIDLTALKAKAGLGVKSENSAPVVVTDENAPLSAQEEETLKEILAIPAYEMVEGETDEKTYSLFKSSRIAMCMITTKDAIRIKFQGYECVTDNPKIIEYLHYEISQGLNVVTYEGEVRSDHRDPMAAMKRQMMIDFAKDQEALAIKAMRAGSNMQGIMTSNRVAN